MKSKRVFDRKNSKYCIEYWISRGYSETDGRAGISQLQREIGARRKKGIKLTDQQKMNISIGTKLAMSKDHMIKKYGEIEGQARYAKLRQSIQNGGVLSSKKKKDAGHNYKEDSVRCVEYWIKRGHSLQDAQQYVAKSQSRGLDFFIAKYGHSEGVERWKKKVASWKKSFQKNDLTLMNEKRKLNAHVGLYSVSTIQNIEYLYLYVIIMPDIDGTLFIKYGLTKHEMMSKRWSSSLNYQIVLFKQYSAFDALKMETSMNAQFKQSYSPSVIQTTECCIFSDDNLSILMNIVEGNHEN